jgi:Lrp/AsnC ligand binding domain
LRRTTLLASTTDGTEPIRKEADVAEHDAYVAEHDAYVFVPEASPDVIAKLRESGLPRGIRYVASVTGPWDLFAIATFDDLGDLPGIVATMNVDPTTALAIKPYYTKTSAYHDHSAFVRINLGEGDPLAVLEGVRDAIGSHEANLVLGDFDMLAYVGANSEDALIQTILHRLRKVPGIRRTVTLRVIDYLTRNPEVPDKKRHLGFSREARAPSAKKPARTPAKRSTKARASRSR